MSAILQASGGIGGSTGSTDRAVIIANGTGGATAQASTFTIQSSAVAADWTTNGDGGINWTLAGSRWLGCYSHVSTTGGFGMGMCIQSGALGWAASTGNPDVSLRRTGAGALAVQKGSDTSNGSLTALNLIATSSVRFAGFTVATLPAGTIGDNAYVTDALAPAFLSTVVGGGAIKTPVFYDGTNWVGA